VAFEEVKVNQETIDCQVEGSNPRELHDRNVFLVQSSMTYKWINGFRGILAGIGNIFFLGQCKIFLGLGSYYELLSGFGAPVEECVRRIIEDN
jgi:hypothetical protein